MALFDLVEVFCRVARQLVRRFPDSAKLDILSENVRTRRDNPEVKFPPSELSAAALNHCSCRRYLETGLAHAKFIMQTIRSHTPARDLSVCEWGCGPGRIIQHLPSLDDGIARLIGTDCHEATIDWCQENMPDIEFLVHEMNPPLTLATGSIDVVYCCAVFTHLGEPLHHAWVSEILRLLRPGGLLIASFHGSRFEDRMATDEVSAFRDGNLVVRPEGREGGTQFVSFAGERFIRERLLNRFENITPLVDAPFLQSVWVATARAT